MNGWQPMDTAPRDGTYILLWSPEDACAISGYYHPGEDESDDLWLAGNIIVNPTNWMPLPEPPQKKDQA